jgi:hypothetical protein
MQIGEETKKIFVAKFASFGEDKFYKFLLNYAVNKIVSNNGDPNALSPEIELMDYHDKFLSLYRRENDEVYLDIARICRRAAHRMYRVLIKKNPDMRNGRFLNAVVVVG